MSEAKLMLHCGARHVPRTELATVPTPDGTRTWRPVSHERVISTVEESLQSSGFLVRKSQFGLSRGDARMFATLDLESALAAGVTLAVGIRNSMDKSFPMGFAAGSRVFICDNLAMRSELLIRRKHTVNGLSRFTDAIAGAVTGLKQFQATETRRIARMQEIEIDDVKAESVMLRAYHARIVSHRVLPDVLDQWREPRFEEFHPRTLFSLLNAFTSAMAPRSTSNPQAYATSTMRLYGVLDQNFPLAIEAGEVIDVKP
ncbi:hypothetical protein EP7_004269 [Isosphaeraceae bacterium EP7]